MSGILNHDAPHPANAHDPVVPQARPDGEHRRVLVTGANGQIGTALVQALAHMPSVEHLVCSDLLAPRQGLHAGVRFEALDVLDNERLLHVLRVHRIDTVYHLSAVLSARGESNPQHTWRVNVDGWLNVLEAARLGLVRRVFFPSTIAVFGPNVPRHATPDEAPLNPTTVYGLSKAAGENWGAYYHQRWGVDVRSLRYPGVVGHQSLPGGGTTDYAVDIFHQLVKGHAYQCYLHADQSLPMIHMDDAIRATLALMTASSACIQRRHGYNLQGMSFSPAELVAEIERQHGPQMVTYVPDARQAIAQNWPSSLDDTHARQQWGWRPEFGVTELVRSMWFHLSQAVATPPATALPSVSPTTVMDTEKTT